MSQTLARKRKHDTTIEVSPSKKKKSRKEGKLKDGKKKKDKSKAKGKEFTIISASLVVSIPPIFSSDLSAGVEEMLDSMIMRYIPAFQGVVLAHSNLQFLDNNATIKADCPFSVCNVGFDATVWSPRISMKLVGRVNLCSPDHISLLVHQTFNVSIPRHHIPTDLWEFEYGPAENDPEMALNIPEKEGDNDSEYKEAEDGGRWVHKITGDRIGGLHGFLEFTVIGLTVANEMLSLLGSIQADPFSSKHVAVHVSPPKSSREPSLDADLLPLGEEPGAEMHRDEENEESDIDTFQRLGKMGEEQRRAEELVKSKTEKKKKRKSDKEKLVKGEKKSKRKKT